ncbi:unnamed protein product [Victoria cruziana]
MRMRVSIDCNGCYKKVRRALIKMPAIHNHVIDRKESRIEVSGTFKPPEVAIALRKRIKRRIEILEIREVDLAAAYAVK